MSVVLVDIVDTSAFPIPSSATGSGTAGSSSDASSTAKALGFKSTDRSVTGFFRVRGSMLIQSVKSFVEQYKVQIIGKLLPGLQKEGYTEAYAVELSLGRR